MLFGLVTQSLGRLRDEPKERLGTRLEQMGSREEINLVIFCYFLLHLSFSLHSLLADCQLRVSGPWSVNLSADSTKQSKEAHLLIKSINCQPTDHREAVPFCRLPSVLLQSLFHSLLKTVK